MSGKFVLKRFLPRKEVRLWKRLAFWIVTIGFSLFVLGIILFAGMIAILSLGLPDVTNLENLTAAQSTEIYDREENLLYTIHGEENREETQIENMSKHIQNATVAMEDDAFYEHGGFDIWALGRVGLHEIFGIGKQRGGSTITQQYIKNTFLSAERTYTRKAKELILAIRLERAYTKEEILELYLNRIPYGNNAYGIQKAAEIYFDKDAKDLTLGESAILSALPQAPSRYNPYGTHKNSVLLTEFTPEELAERNIQSEYDLEIDEYSRGLVGSHLDLGNDETVYIPGRSDLVLKRMEELGMIDNDERQEALNQIQKLEFNDYIEDIKHPHFVLYIKEYLEDKYGNDVVEQGGLKVYTTIDTDLQAHAETVAFAKGTANETAFGANNVAILTINPKTGEILAMVGSRDYFNEEIDGNVNVVFRPRQPGSSFKPFVYAQAFYNGYAPGNVIYDIPTKVGQDEPQNYDGQWKGQISMRQGLGLSRNIPAIKAYFLAGRQDPIIELVEKMGITTLSKTHSYGYPLALGAGEVPLSEMVTAFGVFANNGKKPELTGLLRVENANGDILEEWEPKEQEEVMDPQIAYLINNILSDQNNSVGPTLFVPGHLNAAKTGTSTKANKKESGTSAVKPGNAWTIGYTPSVVTGVWTGNTDGTGMFLNASGYSTAAPIFNSIMTKALEGKSAEPFPEPKGIKKVEISKASGKLPGPKTPASMIVTEIFPGFAVPTEVEKLFFEVRIDKISGLLATEFTPKDSIESVTYQNFEPVANFFKWAEEIAAFYKGKEVEGEESRIGIPPLAYDNAHTAETALQAPNIAITTPTSQTTVKQGTLSVEVDITAPHGIARVEYYLDDKLAFFKTEAPYSGSVFISRFMEDNSRHLLVAKIIDRLGYSAQSAIELKIDK